MNSFQEEIYLGEKRNERRRGWKREENNRWENKERREEKKKRREEGQRKGARVVNYRLRIRTAMERSSARKTLEMPYALGSDNTKVLN